MTLGDLKKIGKVSKEHFPLYIKSSLAAKKYYELLGQPEFSLTCLHQFFNNLRRHDAGKKKKEH